MIDIMRPIGEPYISETDTESEPESNYDLVVSTLQKITFQHLTIKTYYDYTNTKQVDQNIYTLRKVFLLYQSSKMMILSKKSVKQTQIKMILTY